MSAERPSIQGDRRGCLWGIILGLGSALNIQPGELPESIDIELPATEQSVKAVSSDTVVTSRRSGKWGMSRPQRLDHYAGGNVESPPKRRATQNKSPKPVAELSKPRPIEHSEVVQRGKKRGRMKAMSPLEMAKFVRENGGFEPTDEGKGSHVVFENHKGEKLGITMRPGQKTISTGLQNEIVKKVNGRK